ncbi:MAG: hypothetical protein ABI742_00815 [Gemmatimonadota bacterium]
MFPPSELPVRIMTDVEGDSWISLEPPGASREPSATVTVECNSGAERVVLVVSRDWDSLPDSELAARIRAALIR